LETGLTAGGLTEEETERLYQAMRQILAQEHDFIIYEDEKGMAVDFSVVPMARYGHLMARNMASVSEMAESFYLSRDESYRMAQKTADLRKLVNAHMERCRKKQRVYDKTLEEIAERGRLKTYGELLTAYIYDIQKGADTYRAADFYGQGETVDIPLEPTFTAAENAQAYFKQYNKQKRTYAALQGQIRQNAEDLAYLDSVAASIQTVKGLNDIAEIRAELAEQGFVKAKYKKQGSHALKKSKPLHYTSADGFDIYVGKNNTQNDELTLRFARGNDIWLHTKDIAGSHVLIRANDKTVTEAALLEAANLAAYHSKGRDSGQVPVDYALKKYVRKPAGAKPGFVIYDHHKTLYVTPQSPKPRHAYR
jgi:predicted ribosome quality control (RQC) complex YloA/Tae2 family protein